MGGTESPSRGIEGVVQVKIAYTRPFNLIFLLLIDDLQLDCLVHKFVDDTTLSELLASGNHESHMTQYVENLRTWSQANDH